MLKKIIYSVLIFSNFVIGQTNFENGYLIKNNEVVNCLIKFSNPKSNPDKIIYKLDENGEELIADISNTSEFGVINKYKFVRRLVSIDQSSNATNSLTWNIEPEYIVSTVFLRVLVEGKATLLKYETSNLIRFYVEHEDDTEQLVYKRYMVDNNIIKTNDFYKRQLYKILNCNVDKKEIDKVSYHVNDLSELFLKNNECLGLAVNYTEKLKKAKFNLHPKIALQNSKMNIEHNPSFMYSPRFRANFDSKTIIKFGLEFEVVLPYHDYRFSLFLDPSYQSFSNETVTPLGHTAKIDYKSIEIPLGVRYFLYNGNVSKVFTNIGIVYDIPFNSNIQYFNPNSFSTIEFEASEGVNLILGIGYRLNDKFTIELRHSTNRNNFSNTPFQAKYSGTGLMLSYNIF